MGDTRYPGYLPDGSASMGRGSAPRGRPRPWRVFGVPQPVALPARLEDRAAVRQPVQRRPGQPLAAQHLRPLLERQVRRHDHARPLVGRADHVEEQLRPGLARRHVPQLVEDQQVQLRQPGPASGPAAAPRGPPSAASPARSPGRTAPACPGRTPRRPAPSPGASCPCPGRRPAGGSPAARRSRTGPAPAPAAC